MSTQAQHVVAAASAVESRKEAATGKASEAQDDEKRVENEPGAFMCPQVWKPVCGENGKTYGNACVARRALGAQGAFSEGKCDDDDDDVDDNDDDGADENKGDDYPEFQIMCIGDSITRGGHGGEIRDPDTTINGHKVYHEDFPLEKANYPSKMGIMLKRSKEVNVTNLGVSGATAQQDTDMPWKGQAAYTLDSGRTPYDELVSHVDKARCDVAIVMLGTNDAKLDYWNDGQGYKKAYKKLLKEIMTMCTVVFVGLSPPTQCGSADCRFIKEGSDSDEGIGDKDYCCMKEWGDDPDIINKDLANIQDEIAAELTLPTIPFREAIGKYKKGKLEQINSHMQDDTIHPNELGYFEMAKKATKEVNKVLKDYSLKEFEKKWKKGGTLHKVAKTVAKVVKVANEFQKEWKKGGTLLEVGPDGVPQSRRGDSEGTDEANVNNEHMRVEIGTDGSTEAYEAKDSYMIHSDALVRRKSE